MKKTQFNDGSNSKKMSRMKYAPNPTKKKSFVPGGKIHANKKFKKELPDDEEEMNCGEHNFQKKFNESAVKQFIVKPQLKWFDQLPDDPSSSSIPDPQLVATLRKEAENLHQEDVTRYQKFLQKRKEKSDFAWMRTILQSGTLSDKISAHILLIQDSALHNINSIEALISMVTPKGKRECLMAMESLKDLFLSDLLRRHKKLKPFPQQPLEDIDKLTSNNIVARRKRLLLWYFEDMLKEMYLKFVKNVEVVSRDTVEKTKQKAVTVMYALMKDNPEQEQFLLEHLVNKIGDPIAKVGSHVCHLLGQLVQNHPNMIAIVVQEVERILFRQNISERAKYYCICFLSQLILCHELYNIANHLITIYFALFKMCVKKGEVNTKMMSALLSGVSRAFPYSKLKNNVIMEQLDAMFRLVHMVSFNISIQALMLIFQVLDAKESVSDRFYCALYKKILDPDLANSTRQSLLLNLLYKALKKDVANVRVKAFVKRLIQVSVYQSPNLQCGILMLISELAKTHPQLLEAPTLVVAYSDSDSEEHFDDVSEVKSEDSKVMDMKPNTSASWIHKPGKNRSLKGYDPHNRNPLHAGSEYSHLWELNLLKQSFHPSVSLFANQVSRSKDIIYEGDPLADFTLIRFLDRFVYRNPKKVSEHSKADAHRRVFGRKVKSKGELQAHPINSNGYLQQSEDKVPVDERFIYQFLRQRSASGKHRNKDSDIESIGSDEFEELLDSMPGDDEGKKSVDFARDLLSQKPKQKKKGGETDSSESELESLGEESDFEGELKFEEDADFKNAFSEYDEQIETLAHESGSEFIGEDDDDEEDAFPLLQNKKKKGPGKRKLKSSDKDIKFASADEFTALLEDNVGVDAISSEAFVNYDKSAAKQLAWERQRDQFVKGTDWKSRKNKFQKKRKAPYTKRKQNKCK